MRSREVRELRPNARFQYIRALLSYFKQSFRQPLDAYSITIMSGSIKGTSIKESLINQGAAHIEHYTM